MDDGGTWALGDASGRILGRMAKKSFSPPDHAKFVSGEITAILRRYREDNEEAFRNMLRRDALDVVVPDLVFENTK